MPYRHNIITCQCRSVPGLPTSSPLGKSAAGAFSAHVTVGHVTTISEALLLGYLVIDGCVICYSPQNRWRKEVNSWSSSLRTYKAINSSKIRTILGIHRLWSSSDSANLARWFWTSQNFFGPHSSRLIIKGLGHLTFNIPFRISVAPLSLSLFFFSTFSPTCIRS